MRIVDERITPENDPERALTLPAEVRVGPEVRARHRAALLAAFVADTRTREAGGLALDTPDAVAVVELSRPRGWGRRRVTVVVVAALAVSVVGGGLAVALSKLRPSEPAMVRCYAVATTDLDNPGLGFDLGVAAAPGLTASSTAAQALEECGQAWFRGELSGSAPHLPTDFPGGGQSIPHLVACVLPEGFVGVFPGPVGTCAALGLPEADL